MSHEEVPNHMIIWLDLTIGDPEQHIHLKKAFSTTVDPKNETPVKLGDEDYDRFFDVAGPAPVGFEGVEGLFAAFTDAELCMKCFEENQDKRIFFITSGSMGKAVVPIILDRFPHVFTDPFTDEPYNSIYIVCSDVPLQAQWTLAYRNYVQIFYFEVDLLSRMVRDIGDYFLAEGKQLLAKDPPNYPAAQHRLSWSHELYQRYGKMENVSIQKKLNEVNELLENIQNKMKSLSDEDD